MWMHLHTAAHALRQGGVVAYPTEAVYGLGCNPLDQHAVHRLLQIKQRPVNKGLILLGADIDQLLPFIKLSAQQEQQLRQHWPLATTYLVRSSELTPDWVRGDHDKVAVRVSQHPIASELCRLAGTALISTSANRGGQPACRNGFQVARHLGDEVDFIVTGQCDRAARPSTIIDLESGAILRQ
ncbi:MAG: L-threonylcarbamoyladenylate synthase [Alcanivoracaceae bacterium]|nr:L-threonylcarbamoyladenylate synthase [Alcanivoracaceae bacterium]